MRRKVVSAMLLLSMMAGLFAGCGSSTSESTGGNTGTAKEEGTEASDSSDDAGDEVTLTVLAGQSTTDAGIEDMIDEALAEKYPEVTLEWECSQDCRIL